MTGSGIVVEDVRRSFGRVAAVRGVTFTARAGAVTGLVSPNGSGKTTLLLMLSSLLAPDAGRIEVDGVDPIAHPRMLADATTSTPGPGGCTNATVFEDPTVAEVYARTTPSWFVGLGLQLGLAGGLVAGAWSRTRTPSRRTPPGTRIA